MASEFRINQQRFAGSRDRTEHAVPLRQESVQKRLNRLYVQQNAYLVRIDQDIAEFDAKDGLVIKRLEIEAKVVHGFIMVLMIVMPVAFSYLPAWLPWGVGLPTFIVLGLISGRLKEKVEVKKQYNEALQLMRKMLVEQSNHALRPFGEWTLPAVDRRLKSDILMREELSKKHPESAAHIERLVSNSSSCQCPDHPKKKEPKPLFCLDLEVTPTVMMQAARKLVQRPDNMTDWGAIKERVIQAKKLLAEGNAKAYEEAMANIKIDGLKVGGSVPLVGLVPPSPKMQVRSIVSNFQHFNQHYQELHNRYEEGVRLFGAEFYVGWEAYLQSTREIKQEVDKLVQLLERADEVTDREWILAANNAQLLILERGTPQNIALNTMIDSLIKRSLGIERVMARMIATHPTKRIASYRKDLAEKDKEILSAGSVLYLQQWIEQHPIESTQPIWEWISISGREREALPKQDEIDQWISNNLEEASHPIGEAVNQLPAEVGEWLNRNQDAANLPLDRLLYEPQIRTWLQANEELIVDPVSEIYQRNLLMRTEFESVYEWAQDLSSDEDLTPFHAEWVALQKLVGQRGEPSRAKLFWQKISRKLPAHRFEPVKVPEEGGWARSRKIEELVYKKLLKQIDRKMLIQNRVRRYSLELVVQSVLLIVQAIFWSNIYVMLGISAVMVLTHLLSLYFDQYLMKVNKEKQGLKMQMVLRDQSALTRLPGSRPALEQLKGAQDKYGLDGVTRTWARITTEGEEAVLSDDWRETARKGSEEAIPTLESRFLYLLGLQAEGELDPEFATVQEQDNRIEKLQESLYYRPSRQKAPIRVNVLRDEVVEATKERQQIEKRLERVTKEREKMERLRPHRISYFVSQHIVNASKGEHARESDEGLVEEIGTIRDLITQMYVEGGTEELNRRLNEAHERLKLFRIEALREQFEIIVAGMSEMERRDQQLAEEVSFVGRGMHAIDEWRKEISQFDSLPLERQARIHDFVKRHVEEACQGGHERAGGEDLNVLLFTLARIAEEENQEGLQEACEELKQFPVPQLQSWIDHFQLKILEIQQKFQDHLRMELRVAALNRQLKDFKIEEPASYQQLVEWEEEEKEQLKQALAYEREKKILFALEKQLIKVDEHIKEKREALPRDIKAQGDRTTRGQLQRRLDALNQMLKAEKERLATSLATAENLESINQAVNRWIQQLNVAMNQQVAGDALIHQQRLIRIFLMEELKIVGPFQGVGDFVPELRELVFDEVPEPILSPKEKLEGLIEQGGWGDNVSFNTVLYKFRVRELYRQLNPLERDSIWWRLPRGFREELV